MSRRSPKRTLAAPAYPLWIRGLAAFCLALITFASFAQATHTHGLGRGHDGVAIHAPAASSPGSTAEDRCPLCVAMHSALPSQQRLMPVAAAVSGVALVERTQAAHDSPWHFARFSRPPPSAV